MYYYYYYNFYYYYYYNYMMSPDSQSEQCAHVWSSDTLCLAGGGVGMVLGVGLIFIVLVIMERLNDRK